jgi:uncharacterized damage-inducible protein DinB
MNEELSKLIDEAHAISAEAQTVFGHLSQEQLNWKPAPEEWSVAQCFDHLIVTNSGYFPLVKKIADGQYEPSFRERLPLLPRAFGSIVLNAVQPEAQRKFKAVPKFQPSSSAIQGDILARFTTHQEDLVKHMRMTEELDLRKIIITSPVMSLMTYSLWDAYKIMVAHERRHMAQAKRVMDTPGFPKA